MRAIASSTALSCFKSSSLLELAFLAALMAAAAALALLSRIGGDSRGRFLPAIVALRSAFLTGVVEAFCLICCFEVETFGGSMGLDDSLRAGTAGEIAFRRRNSTDEPDE